MGIFVSFFKQNNKIEIAEALFDTLCMSLSVGDDKISQKVDAVLKSCNSRTDILLKIVELCSPPKTPDQLYIVSHAYSWAGAKYRKETIHYYNLYLTGKPSERERAIRHNKNIHLANCNMELAAAYEGEYDFENALTAYEKSFLLNPSSAAPYIKYANILIKQHQIDEAIDFLINLRESKYYPPVTITTVLGTEYVDDRFCKVIESYIEETIDKKIRGYVYRPRGRK